VALYGGARGAAFYDRFTWKKADVEGGSSRNGRAGRRIKSFRISLMTVSCTLTAVLSQGGTPPIVAYKEDYNSQRPHSALRHLRYRLERQVLTTEFTFLMTFDHQWSKVIRPC
jgi:hypothetical protein